MKTILVIPDPHDEPGVDQSRFTLAGEWIVKHKPDAVVCLGDGATFDSLSRYDKGSITAEGRRYKDDLESWYNALELLHGPMNKWNHTMCSWKKRKYKPDLHYCIGNHEQRILKAAAEDPKLWGLLTLDDLRLQERGWEVYDLTTPASVYGIAFAHYFTSGIMGRPVAGIHHARTLVDKTHCTVVVGHSHMRQMWEDTDVFGNKITGIVAGCFFEHDSHYTTENDRAWRGLVQLKVHEDHVDPNFISIDELKE